MGLENYKASEADACGDGTGTGTSQNKIQENLGLNVNIQNKKNNSGKITILYQNLEQFELVSNLLKKN